MEKQETINKVLEKNNKKKVEGVTEDILLNLPSKK